MFGLKGPLSYQEIFLPLLTALILPELQGEMGGDADINP